MSQGGDPQQRLRKNNTGPNALPLSATSRGSTGPQTNMHPADDDSDDFDEPMRPNTSTIRRDTFSQQLPGATSPTTPVPSRRRTSSRDFPLQPRQTVSRELPRSARNTTSQYAPSTGGATRTKKRTSNVHWLLPVGIGMVAMLVLWVFGSLAVAWGQQRYQDITYGRPRTYQTDVVVGHNDSPKHPSHFIAINYNRQATVTEWMGGDPAKTVVYVVPYYIVGDNSELTPVTVELRDVTGDLKPDLIIHIHLSTQDQTFVFVNDGSKFRPPLASDKITM